MIQQRVYFRLNLLSQLKRRTMASPPPSGCEGLPGDIQQMLKRKSSRDPMSRFSKKLHTLLMYAGDDPNRQEFVGAGWTSNSAFRINKKRLIAVMEIKHNTLNVNLKDLKFHQLETEKNGWSVWERPGFTRFSSIDQLVDVKSEKDVDLLAQPGVLDDAQLAKLSMLRDMTVGFIDPGSTQLFKRFTVSIWEELVGSPLQCAASPSELLHLAAERFRASHQKLDNALRILKAIFVCADATKLTILDFAKFMARFGPEETLMQKLDSILKSSNRNQNWLKLSRPPAGQDAPEVIYGYFDENEHNCFVLHRMGQPEEKIYNLLHVPATDEYLVDIHGQRYASWQKYFDVHPIPAQTWSAGFDWPQFGF
jgi:hypothetical protein